LPAAPFLPNDIPPLLNGNPLVFWNACFSAGAFAAPASDSTGILTEFGSRFISCGASHFVGSPLPIVDQTGKEFACCFYSNLFGERMSVGEAFFIAKSKVATTDPIVHAYVLYGNPAISVVDHA
jgi:Peptidase family C25